MCELYRQWMCLRSLTYDSEVLVEESHIDWQQLRESDGQAAAQTDVWISRIRYIQHWQRDEEI